MAETTVNRKVSRIVKHASAAAAGAASLADESLKPPIKDAATTGPEFDGWKRLQANCGSGEEGYYVKVYKEVTPEEQGRFARRKYLFSIENPLSIEDFEPYVQQRAVEAGWGAGNYVGSLYRRGVAGSQGTIIASIEIPAPLVGKGSGDSPDGLAGLLAMMKPLQILRQLKEMVGGEGGPSADLVKTIGESLQTGLKAGTQAASGGTDLMRILIEKLLTQKETVAESFLDQFIKLKNSGIIPIGEAEKADAIGRVNEAIQLAESVRPLLGGAPRREPNFLEALGPYLPAIFQALAAPINTYLQTRQIELTGANPSLRILPEAPKGAQPMPPSPIDETVAAIKRGDTSRFPAIEQMILNAGPDGQQFIAAAQRGLLTAEKAQELLAAAKFPGINEPGSTVYIGRFITWLSEKAKSPSTLAAPTPDAPPFEVKARGTCTKCGLGYSYPAVEAFNPQEPCDATAEGGTVCGGEIKLYWPTP